ncbi:LON peptidase substrate-binding domain-containing protein [Thalassotalea maritima]|uniref:LON peptidase substrate-binding domain-containing protein n=1 Tax=Thalassotalea maritima TaxID=3242416 RepID=UPI003527DA22
MKIPVFPLPIYLLPGGITRLRIFEQRYLNMVKNAHKTNGFVISLHRPEMPQQVGDWGSWVDIIDFQMGEDNLLIIDVKCRTLVRLSELERTEENLLLASFREMPHWQPIKQSENTREFSRKLKSVFTANEQLAKLYQGEFNNDPNWVCARWLELFPISFDDKDHFAKAGSEQDAVDFLTAIIVEQRQSDSLLG